MSVLDSGERMSFLGEGKAVREPLRAKVDLTLYLLLHWSDWLSG